MEVAATCSGICLLNTLGSVGGLGSEMFGGMFAKYFGASRGGGATKLSVEFSLSSLGPVEGFGNAFDASPVFSTSATYLAPERLCCLMI